LFQLFATGVNDTSSTDGKFTGGVIDTSGKFTAGVVDTGRKFTTGVIDTGGKFVTGVVETGFVPWIENISTQFRKKFEPTLMLFSRAWGQMIHEKTLSQKSCDTVPLSLEKSGISSGLGENLWTNRGRSRKVFSYGYYQRLQNHPRTSAVLSKTRVCI
jgi:hypothetical protein